MHTPALSFSDPSRSSGGTLMMLAICLVSVLALSGCPSSKQPRPFTGSDLNRTARYEFGGIPVVQVQEARPYVHVELLFKRLSGAGRGLEGLAIQALARGGAGKMDAYDFAAKMEAAGGLLDHVERESHVALRLRCLPEDLKNSFRLMTSLLIEPSLDYGQVQALVDHATSSERNSGELPAHLAENLLRESAFSGTPETLSTRPSPESLKNAASKDFLQGIILKGLLSKCNMTLVVVGPSDVETIGDLVFGTIDQLPEGDCPEITNSPLRTGLIAVQHQASGLEAVCAAIPAPSASAPDAFAMDAAAKILDAQLRERLVNKLKIALTCEVNYVPLPPAHVRIQISGPRITQASELALSEVRKYKEVGIRPSALDSAKQWILSEQQMTLESSANWAKQAAIASTTNGWECFGNPQERLKALTPSHVQYVLEKHATGISWGFVGDTTRLDRRSLLRI